MQGHSDKLARAQTPRVGKQSRRKHTLNTFPCLKVTILLLLERTVSEQDSVMSDFGCYGLGLDQHLVKSQGHLPHEGDTVGSMKEKSLHSHYNRQRKPWNHCWIWRSANQAEPNRPSGPRLSNTPQRNSSSLWTTLHLSKSHGAMRFTPVLFTGSGAENSMEFPEILHITGAFVFDSSLPLVS